MDFQEIWMSATSSVENIINCGRNSPVNRKKLMPTKFVSDWILWYAS